jgi:predicted nucleic acid-binding protein
LIGTIFPFDSDAAVLSAKIRATHKTKISDAIIIATAITTESSLVSFDRKMMGIYERIK